MRKLAIVLIKIFFVTTSLYSQTRVVKGKAVANDFDILPGVLIFINDTTEVGRTTLDGTFVVHIPVTEYKLHFKYPGADEAIILLTEGCSEIEVILLLSGTYDFISLRKVDRLRIKLHRKLPLLHGKAYESGLFKTHKPCYTRIFIPLHSSR